ncbi:hypothetical protein MKX01_022955, partial [Papaver californicum]
MCYYLLGFTCEEITNNFSKEVSRWQAEAFYKHFRRFEQADLSKPETVPATLVSIHTLIDCATGHPEEPIKT